MQDTESEIKRVFYSYNTGEDNTADGLLLIAEQLRIANLLKAKELGMQIPDELILLPLVSEETANSIIKNNNEMRLDLRK